MTCCVCGEALNMSESVRIELSGRALFVVQYACVVCGLNLAREIVPADELPAIFLAKKGA